MLLKTVRNEAIVEQEHSTDPAGGSRRQRREAPSGLQRPDSPESDPPERPRETFRPQLEGQLAFTEAQAKCFLKDAAEGITYLHEDLGVCHRDLKVDNLLLGADGRVSVGDFGSAETFDANGRVRHTKGTYMFMAPECLRPLEDSKPYQGYDGRAADCWALGICAFVMVYGIVPFKAHCIESLFEAIGKGIVEIPESPPISAELADFFKQVLEPEWERRISARQILAHPWIASANFEDAANYSRALEEQRLASL